MLSRPCAFLFALFTAVFGSLLTPFTIYGQAEPAPPQQQQQQALVEAVDVQGNRRYRDQDALYHVQTRQGDPFNQQQVEADFQALLALNWFDKTESKVSVRDGARGGIEVIFEVKELPIIRDIQFNGLKSVTEADVLKAFRENRIGVSKESIYDPVKINNAKRLLKELLSARGHPQATIVNNEEEVSATSIALNFDIKEGERVRVVEIEFEGNEVFSDGQLRGQMQFVKQANLVSRFQGKDILDRQKLSQDLQRVRNYMAARGYLQSRYGEPRTEELGRRRTGSPIPLPLLSSTDEALRVVIPVVEGRLYRIGEMKIEGNSIFSEQIIRNILRLAPGDIANGERIGKGLQEDLKRAYGSQGFIQYDYDVQPTFRDSAQNPKEGIADFTISLNEGRQFTLRRLEFLGNNFTRDNVLRREVLVNEGDVYNQAQLEYSVQVRLNQLGFFDPIDKEKDVELRTNEEEGEVDVNIKVAERGRQQISFNGGVSGIGGSFFGFDYSTNNLLGRGESLSFNVAAGNRQRSFVFSFTEPYIQNRPITVGFSLFTSSYRYFGFGEALLSQNTEALRGFNPIDSLNVDAENLFTQNQTGASVFLSAPLSEFYRRRRFTLSSRIGLSYSVSQSSVRDPEVNRANNQSTFIPVLYNQSNILTSRITPTFIYDTREGTIDPPRGKQITLSLGLAGLGGDVRTYAPSASYIQFIPVRRKKSDKPEVFGFRLQAATIGSFAKTGRIREAEGNSLAFINGVPLYERFFLGDEFTIRGYDVRRITPYAPLDTYVTTRNVVLASNADGTPEPVAGLPASIADVGLLTGPTGNNVVRIPSNATITGGDTQLLGNFEYRIPIFGPVALAAFADIGTSFNLRNGANQTYSSQFLGDVASPTGVTFLSQSVPYVPFRGGILEQPTLSALVVAANPQLALSPSQRGLVLSGDRLVTQEELNNASRVGPVDRSTGLPVGFQEVFMRGEAQTNTVVSLSQSLFSKLSDYRSSLGAELRVQVPVINVPFRLIYAYNPNSRPELGERRTAFRFSIGRTF